MSRTRDISKLLNDSVTISTFEELATVAELDTGLVTASAAAVSYLIDGAPGALDTLNELAAALNDNESFATTVTNELSSKLSTSSASSTYLSQISASTTYATKAQVTIDADSLPDTFLMGGY